MEDTIPWYIGNRQRERSVPNRMNHMWTSTVLFSNDLWLSSCAKASASHPGTSYLNFPEFEILIELTPSFVPGQTVQYTRAISCQPAAGPNHTKPMLSYHPTSSASSSSSNVSLLLPIQRSCARSRFSRLPFPPLLVPAMSFPTEETGYHRPSD